MKDETITLACCGCIHKLTVYCTHCLRGDTVKDFYDNGKLPLPTGENDTTINDNFTSELEQ